jgi:hypothetical protein
MPTARSRHTGTPQQKQILKSPLNRHMCRHDVAEATCKALKLVACVVSGRAQPPYARPSNPQVNAVDPRDPRSLRSPVAQPLSDGVGAAKLMSWGQKRVTQYLSAGAYPQPYHNNAS